MAVTGVTDAGRQRLLGCFGNQQIVGNGPMRHAHTAERWNQPYILRNLIVTLAVALGWMVAVAATY